MYTSLKIIEWTDKHNYISIPWAPDLTEPKRWKRINCFEAVPDIKKRSNNNVGVIGLLNPIYPLPLNTTNIIIINEVYFKNWLLVILVLFTLDSMVSVLLIGWQRNMFSGTWGRSGVRGNTSYDTRLVTIPFADTTSMGWSRERRRKLSKSSWSISP